MARFPAIRFGLFRWTFLQIDDLLQGGPGFLITLGLIGTFSGLIQNMSRLSALLLIGEGVSSQASLIKGFAAIFPSMGAAFSTSLFGIFLSTCLWILSILLGISRIKIQLEQLLCGYLEQVVQADCRCYSLVGESMERMEAYLTDYLSKFTDHVGRSIESSINNAIKRLILSLSDHIDATKGFVQAVSSGSTELKNAGEVFAKATDKLHASSFANEFASACELFIDHTRLLDQSARHINDSSRRLAGEVVELSKVLVKTKDMQGQLIVNLLAAMEALHTSADDFKSASQSSNDEMRVATEAMQGSQKRGMRWLSTRAKTDAKLVEVIDLLQNLLLQFTQTTDKINTSSEATFDAYRFSLHELAERSQCLLNASRNQEASMNEVRVELQKIAEEISVDT